MLIWEPVHERPSREAAFVRHARAALSVGLACSRTTQYAPRARPPSALHLATPEQAPPPKYSDTLLAGPGRCSLTHVLPSLPKEPRHGIHRMIVQRRHPRLRPRLLQRRGGIGVRHGQAPHPRGAGGLDAGEGIFDREARRGSDGRGGVLRTVE